jgi:hypothetical protein
MAFEIPRMLRFSAAAIAEFARRHEAETFYAFAIDASMLCLNSEECAAATLKKYQERWERYRRPRLLMVMKKPNKAPGLRTIAVTPRAGASSDLHIFVASPPERQARTVAHL